MLPSEADAQGRSPTAAPSSESSFSKGLSDLGQFVQRMTGESLSRVEETLGCGYVRLGVEEAERRQAAHDIQWVEDAVIELLRNARDASASHIYVATAKTANARSLVVIDDGTGIPLALQERIFEARVTSKLDAMVNDQWGIHGRGMALFSIRQRAPRARVAASAPGLGTSIAMEFEDRRLKERADQSTWPTVVETEEGSELRGPRNIARACAEFALQHFSSSRVQVFLGSPAEIAATLRFEASISANKTALLLAKDLSTLPLAQRLFAAADASQFCEQAQAMGLSLSERTAHRILGGNIQPLHPVIARLRHHASQRKPAPLDLTRDCRSLKLSEEDTRDLERRLVRAFEPVRKRYFLELKGSPHLSVRNGTIVATFHVMNEEEG